MDVNVDVLSVSMKHFSTNFVTAIVLALAPLAKAMAIPQDGGSRYAFS